MNATTPAEAGEAYSPDPLAGTSVRTLRKLGEGSMGVVVEAENIERDSRGVDTRPSSSCACTCALRIRTGSRTYTRTGERSNRRESR